jgi:hypothetical protein
MTTDFPERVIVMNCEEKYWKYGWESKSYAKTSPALLNFSKVIRLVDAESHQRNGWVRVTIVFASPGAPNLKAYREYRDSVEFIMPTWSLEELKLANEVCIEPALDFDELERRYYKFGGIPGFIWQNPIKFNILLNDESISSTDLSDVVKSANSRKVDVKHYNHRILQMVPSNPDLCFVCYVTFLSDAIAEEVFPSLEVKALESLLQFALIDREDTTCMLRGKIHELFVHILFGCKGSLLGRSL